MNRFQTIAVLTLTTAVWVTAYPRPNAEDSSTGDIVDRIREEGFQRSRVMDIAGYMCDVLGARLTNSRDMKRAQVWALEKMTAIGLADAHIEPFMDYGVSWDNEFFSLHLLEPDYQPMMGYPLTHTPGTGGRIVCSVVIADGKTLEQLEPLRGKLAGCAVLSTPPAVIDLDRMARATLRRTEEELRRLEAAVIIKPRRRRSPSGPANPLLLKEQERMAFFKREGVRVVFECRSGRPGLVRGFSRPGTKQDNWSREQTMDALPQIAVTPEHYNRMYRIRQRNIPIRVQVEVRNRIGEQAEEAANIIADIRGGDRREEIVMIGAHFDTWHASPNASDNTSGCAVVLEAARILQTLGVRPRRTIRVALWGGEEQGLHGSREYVRAHFGNPLDPEIGVKPDYENLSLYLNQDYGAGAYRGIWLQGNEFARRIFSEWMLPVTDIGFRTLSIQGVGSTDHVSFDQVGLPGFQFIQDHIPGTAGHTNLDFFDTLQADDLKKNAVIMAVLAYRAAMSDHRMPRKTIPSRVSGQR